MRASSFFFLFLFPFLFLFVLPPSLSRFLAFVTRLISPFFFFHHDESAVGFALEIGLVLQGEIDWEKWIYATKKGELKVFRFGRLYVERVFVGDDDVEKVRWMMNLSAYAIYTLVYDFLFTGSRSRTPNRDKVFRVFWKLLWLCKFNEVTSVIEIHWVIFISSQWYKDVNREMYRCYD